MADKYTVYPDHLKKRIEAVDSFMADVPKFREWWNSLPAEERTRLEALPPDEQQKEIDRLRGIANPADPDPNQNLNPEEPENQDNPLPPEGETIESLKAKLEKAEQKYRTLQGMIKDPAELERQNNFLLNQIKMLQDQIYELKKPEAQPATPAQPVQKFNVREALKPHYDKLSEDLAPEILEKEIQKDEKLFELLESRADQRISEVATKFDGHLKLSKEQQFYKDLSDWGDWKAMWGTPEFQAFLSEEADVTGVERYAIIQDAFGRLDSRIVLRAFDKFTGKGGVLPKEPKPTSGIDPSKVKNRVAAPRSSGAAPNPNNPNPNANQLSPQEARKKLTELTADYSRGLYKGNKDQYDKEYARLFNLARGGTG